MKKIRLLTLIFMLMISMMSGCSAPIDENSDSPVTTVSKETPESSPKDDDETQEKTDLREIAFNQLGSDDKERFAINLAG